MSTMQTTVSDKRFQYAVGALALAGLLGAAYFGYSYYKRTKEEAAYKELSELIEGYSKAQTEETPHWADIEKAFSLGAAKHSSSNLYPYFLAYQADALSQQGKLKEAIQILEQAVVKIDRSQPLYYAYAIKKALMKIDLEDATLAQEGRNELNQLSVESANPLKDVATHYKASETL